MRVRTGVLVVLLAAAACGDEDQTQTEYTPSNDRTATSTDDSIAIPARVVPGVADTASTPLPPQDTTVLALAPLGTATVRGSGQLAAAGKASSLSVTLAGGAPGATYEGAVRQGACSRLGSAVAPLYPVSADSLGGGRASSSVPVPPDSLTRGRHVVVYGRGGRPETCGAIPSQEAPV